MAKDLWYDKINRNVDWGGDENTNNFPVAGSAVQEFIKSELNSKISIIYHDEIAGRYLCFAHEEDRDKYLADKTLTYLVLGSFIAPSSYKAKVKVDTHYHAVLINSKENVLTFDYEITNNDEEFVDNIRYTVTVTKNGKSSTINGTGIYGRPVSINMDEYFTVEGTTEVNILITGQTTNAVATTVITYEVVNLEFTSNYDISKVYDLNADIIDPLVIEYSIFGSSNIKYIEWYIDGEYLETDTIPGGTSDAIVDNKNISVIGLNHGVHNVQCRAYVVVNGENFYTDVLYREFMVVSDNKDMTPMIAIETVVPKEYGITNSIKLYNVVQYESYTLDYGVYNPKNLEYIPVEIYLNDVLSTIVNAPNGKRLSYSFTSNESGNKTIKFKSGDYEKNISTEVDKTEMNLQDITNNLSLDLYASGRTNQDSNRDQWVYGDYITSFNGFNWSAASGWNDNRLIISSGMSIENTYKPLYVTKYGKTIEVEFETTNVTNDDAVVCDLRDNNGLGLLITASKATMAVGFGEKESVSSNYKANENVRISFVLDSINKLAIIYVNGIMSGAVAMTSSISIDKTLVFTGSDDASIKIKQIRIYDTQLSSEQVLNNYILYRDTISEIKEVYSRNDILDGKLISIEKVSDYIPVVLLTGEEIFWLESQKDTDIEIKIDVEYINKQDPTHQFKFYGGCCRIQGTSSAGYVRKNWRIYSKRKEKFVADVYDWQGNLVNDKKRRIAFKEGAVPVNCWTMKADFAESSGTHNTGVATIWNDVMYNAYHTTEGYICRTAAQKAAIDNNYKYDCRTTVDGFPIVVFARRNDSEDYTFMGKYNFNNDKSTENVFGFCDIPGFDDAYIPGHEGEVIPEGEFNAGKEYTYGNKMQCWEVRENFDNYALFKTTVGWDDPQIDDEGNIRVDEDKIPIKNWATGFEARYPDDGNEADTSDLKAFAEWIISCDKEKFAIEKKDHLDLWKIAAYYVYLYRFGAVDQVVKNSMFTSEDGKHWYFINYDNDTILGLDNSGNIAYPPTITRNTPSGADYAYAGHESKLWNMLEGDSDFMTYFVPEVDNALFGGGLKYENALQYFNVNQSDKWCESVYNEDANYKYIKPYISGVVNELPKMHGSRKAHRTWWLSKRFQLMDAKFNNDNYKGKHIHMKLDGSPGAEFKIKASDYMYFGCEYNKNPWAMGIELNKGEEYTFYKPSPEEDEVNGKKFAQGDPIYIYSPLYIEELDLSKVSEYIYVLEFGKIVDDVISSRMKKLIIGGNKTAKPISTLSGFNALPNLEYLDLTGVDYPNIDISELLMLKTLILTDSTINTLTIPDGCMIEDLYISDSLRSIYLNGLANLKLENIHGFDTYHVSSINISNSPALTNDYGFYYRWVQDSNPGDELNLSGLYWDDVSPETLIEFKKIVDNGGKLNLKGKIKISDPTIEQVNALQELFGKNCFTNNSELWISAPESVFIHGPKEIRSGDSQIFTTTIFSENPGTVEWEIVYGGEFVESIESKPDNTGLLKTIEDEDANHTIIIKAIHKPKDDGNSIHWKAVTYEVLVKKVIYSTGGSISGNATIKKDEEFKLTLSPYNYNGDYSTEWYITGNSFSNGDIQIGYATNDSVIVKYINDVIFEACELVARVTNKNGSTHDVILPITITDESVLMTSTSNPEVIKICYDRGWCESPNVMYKNEAWVLLDIGNAFQASNIKHFDEFAEFTSLISLPNQAFFQCYSLESIKLPEGLQKIGSFSLGANRLKTIKIPGTVTSINYSSFDGSTIEYFEVGTSSVSYYTIDGILVSSSDKMVKYPEGKTDSFYTIHGIRSLGQWCLRNTKLESLDLGSIEIIEDTCIVNNDNLKNLTIGSNTNINNLARYITSNSSLQNLYSNNNSLVSIDGVLYDQSKSVLVKYPEGRNYFNIEQSVKTIGSYAVHNCLAIREDLIIPDSVEVVEAYGFNGLQYITAIIFNSTSNLTTIKNNGFQLSSRVIHAVFPATLQYLGSKSLSGAYILEEIKFLGNDAPEIFADTFGDGSDYAGLKANNRIVYVPSNSIGYDREIWVNTIFNENRTYIDTNPEPDVTYNVPFTLSKTL